MTYKQLIKHYKTVAAAAKALGIDPRNVGNWKSRGIPKDKQLEYQELTGGKLKAAK